MKKVGLFSNKKEVCVPRRQSTKGRVAIEELEKWAEPHIRAPQNHAKDLIPCFLKRISLLADREFTEERTFNCCVGVKLNNLFDKWFGKMY